MKLKTASLYVVWVTSKDGVMPVQRAFLPAKIAGHNARQFSAGPLL